MQISSPTYICIYIYIYHDEILDGIADSVRTEAAKKGSLKLTRKMLHVMSPSATCCQVTQRTAQ